MAFGALTPVLFYLGMTTPNIVRVHILGAAQYCIPPLTVYTYLRH